MPPPPIKKEYPVGDIMETLLAGHKQARPDLPFPESHSDMTYAVMNLLRKYEVKLRPVPLDRDDLIEQEV